MIGLIIINVSKRGPMMYFHLRYTGIIVSWWRHQMETFSVLLEVCAGNLPVTGEFPPQRPVTRSFDVFYDLRLKNNRLSKQSWGWWFETLSHPLWRHCDVAVRLKDYRYGLHIVMCCCGLVSSDFTCIYIYIYIYKGYFFCIGAISFL